MRGIESGKFYTPTPFPLPPPPHQTINNDQYPSFLSFLFTEYPNPIPDHPKVELFGCFAKTTNRGKEALDSMESDKCFLIDDNGSRNRTEAFEKCAWSSYKRGYKLFGLDGNKSCCSGFVTTSFYKGGYKADCTKKAGGYDSNVVYYFPGN